MPVQLALVIALAFIIFAPMVILFLAYLNEDITVRKVGGITHVKAWSLRLSLSIARNPLTRAQKRRQADARRNQKRELIHWAKLGWTLNRRNVELKHAAMNARIDRQIALIDWQPDDWTLAAQREAA